MEQKRTIGIVGTGMIASSMANLCTGHGFPTVVIARSDASIERLMKSYHTNFSTMIGHGVMTEQQAHTCLSYLTVSKDGSELKIYELEVGDSASTGVSNSNGWVLPVCIVAGVIVVAAAVLLVVFRKKIFK